MRNVAKFFSIFLFVINWTHTHSQNLVPNYSFETYTTCPTGGSQISKAVPWQGVTTNSTDYFNSCAVAGSGTSVPVGGGGAFQYARTGVAYSGMWCINSFGGDYREYLQIQLDSVLQTDSCYYVEFYCNLNNLSYYAINGMGALLSNSAVSTVGPSTWGLVLQYTPQIKSHVFLTDTLNWMKVAGYYRALGGEKYLTIGNFDLDDPADTMQIPAGTYPGAYYYVDDVIVMKVPGCDTVGVGVQEIAPEINNFNIYPSPSTGVFQLRSSIKLDDASIFIYDITGRLIRKDFLGSTQENELDYTSLSSGLYYYSVVQKDKVLQTDKLIILR